MDAPRTQFARTLARRSLKELGCTAPPVPVEEALRFFGLTLAREKHDRAWSGTLRGDRVVVNATHQPSRQRFTAAHELGHVRLGHTSLEPACLELEPDGGLPRRVLPADVAQAVYLERSKVQEIEANEFAAELLAPRAWVKAHWRKLHSAEKMAELFGLSGQAMWVGLMRAGCIKLKVEKARF
jgi:Zn-dependent peptidase ImmA (M78 family)